MRTVTCTRPAVALMGVLIALTMVGFAMVAITWQMVASKGFLERRQHQYQSLWLARSGLEMGAAHLLADGKYMGESASLIADSKITIEVRPEKGTDVFRITSEARYPEESRAAVVRSVSCRVRRLQKDGKARLEVLKPDRDARVRE